MFYLQFGDKKSHSEGNASTVSRALIREPEFDHLVATELRHHDFRPSLHRFKGGFSAGRDARHTRNFRVEFEGTFHIVQRRQIFDHLDRGPARKIAAREPPGLQTIIIACPHSYELDIFRSDVEMPSMHDLSAPTQKQMAARLGVSQALVSRALSGRAGEIGASHETVKKICRMAAEWNYQPSATALALLGAPTRTIGVVVKNFDDPYFGRLIGTLQALARGNKHSLLLTGPSKEDLTGLQRHRVDAVILAGSDFLPKGPVKLERVIQIGTGKVFPGATQIHMDEGAGIDEVINYLAGLGHREIGFVTRESKTNHRRAEMLRKSLRARGFSVRKSSFISVAGNESTAADRAVKTLLGLARMPTAVVAAEDSIALALLRALHEAGLRVPQDISLAGIDDIPASAQAIPPLTTLRQPISKMAAAAFHAIADRQQKTVSIPGKLMIRSSCATILSHKIIQ